MPQCSQPSTLAQTENTGLTTLSGDTAASPPGTQVCGN